VDFHCLQWVPEVFSQLNQSDHFLTLHYLALLVLTVRADWRPNAKGKDSASSCASGHYKKESERRTDETEDKFCEQLSAFISTASGVGRYDLLKTQFFAFPLHQRHHDCLFNTTTAL
jgi:hypothetical protein